MGSCLFNRYKYVVGGALAFVVGCGSKFSAADASVAGGSGSGGGSAAGGSAGDASPNGGDSGNAGASVGGSTAVGGESGSSNSAGTGGKPSSCSCTAGNYCQDGANRCRPCADFSRLEFAAPQKLSTAAQPLRSDRFPRAASAGTDLFYRSATANVQRIWYTAAIPGTATGTAISLAGNFDSGPLLAAGVLQQNFYFDRLVDATTGLRHIMLANWANGALSGETLASAPLNSVASDFSIAVAPGAARAYWMSTRNAKASAELLAAGMVGGAATEPAVVDLQVQAKSATCPWLGGDPKTGDDDATPWVNSAGTVLLFRSVSVDEQCMPNDSGGFDLYAAQLSKDSGLPTGPGVPLSSLNAVGGGSTQSDPSFSTNACSIYFASDDGTETSSLYVAVRN